MIIVGLGNPGRQHAETRHNIGFMVIQALANRLHSSPWKTEFGVRWTTADGHWIVQPYDYMNASGPTLKTWLEKKKIAPPAGPSDLLVVHDDVDFPLGEIHQQVNRSAAGHNGVQSVIDALGTQNFSRLRIGIGHNRQVNLSAEDYVLQKFSAAERPAVRTAVDQAVDILSQRITAT